jgi:uncharacterized protein YhdP
LARLSGRGNTACSEGVTLRSWREKLAEASRRTAAALEQHGRQGFWRQAPISERSKALKAKAQERSRGETNPGMSVLCLLDRLAGSVGQSGRWAGSPVQRQERSGGGHRGGSPFRSSKLETTRLAEDVETS